MASSVGEITSELCHAVFQPRSSVSTCQRWCCVSQRGIVCGMLGPSLQRRRAGATDCTRQIARGETGVAHYDEVWEGGLRSRRRGGGGSEQAGKHQRCRAHISAARRGASMHWGIEK